MNGTKTIRYHQPLLLTSCSRRIETQIKGDRKINIVDKAKIGKPTKKSIKLDAVIITTKNK